MRKTLAFVALTAFAAGATAPDWAFATPSGTEILSANKAATGGDAWTGKAALKLDYAYSGQGLTGKTTSLDDLKAMRWVDTYALGPINGGNGFDGSKAWEKEPSGTAAYQEGGDAQPLAINEAYRRANLWWKPGFGGASVSAREETQDGTAYDVLTVTPKQGAAFDAWFDAKTHLLVRIKENHSGLSITTLLSDYRSFDGVKLAGKTVVTTGGDKKYDQTQLLTTAVFLPEQPAEAFAMPESKAGDFTIAGGAKQTSIPFTLINNHIYADVKVDGKGPYTFIFDTGGLNLVTPTLGKELGLKIEGKLEGRGAGEKTVEAGVTEVKSLQLGDATMTDQAFMAFPLDAMSNVEGTPMIGMVGFQTFRRFITRIDYGTHTMTLIDPKAFDAKDAGTPVKIVFNGNTPEVDGSYDGIAARFQIDTGSRSALTLTSPFADTHKLRDTQTKMVHAVDGWGVGGPTYSDVVRGGKLTIGGVEVDRPVTGMSTDKKGAFADNVLAGNIGAGVLKRFVVTFDYAHNTMYVKPVSGPVEDYGTYDRAGMWFNEAPEGFKVVAVTATAPAEAAGFKEGDTITAVDGKPAKEIKLYDLRRRLRNDAPGTVVDFTVTRGPETRDIKVTLKDLI